MGPVSLGIWREYNKLKKIQRFSVGLFISNMASPVYIMISTGLCSKNFSPTLLICIMKWINNNKLKKILRIYKAICLYTSIFWQVRIFEIKSNWFFYIKKLFSDVENDFLICKIIQNYFPISEKSCWSSYHLLKNIAPRHLLLTPPRGTMHTMSHNHIIKVNKNKHCKKKPHTYIYLKAADICCLFFVWHSHTSKRSCIKSCLIKVTLTLSAKTAGYHDGDVI